MRFFIIAALILSSISAATAGKRKQMDYDSSDFTETNQATKRQKININNLLEEFKNTSLEIFIEHNDIDQILEEFQNHSWHDEDQEDAITFLGKLIATNNIHPYLKEKATYILWDINKIVALTSCCLILHENNDWLIPFLNETIYKENMVDELFETYKDNEYIKTIKNIFVRSQHSNVIPFLNETIYKNKSYSGKEFFYLLNTITILFQNMDQNLIESTLERFNNIFADPNLHHESACRTLISLILQGPNTQTPFDCLETLSQITITNDLIKNVLCLSQNLAQNKKWSSENKKWNPKHYNAVLLALDKSTPNKRPTIVQAITHLLENNWWGASQYNEIITAFNKVDKNSNYPDFHKTNIHLLFAEWIPLTHLLLPTLKYIKKLKSETLHSIITHVHTLTEKLKKQNGRNNYSPETYFWLIKAFCQTPKEKHNDIVNCILSMPKMYASLFYQLIRSIDILGTNKEIIQDIELDLSRAKPEDLEAFFDPIKSTSEKLNLSHEINIKIIKIICNAKLDKPFSWFTSSSARYTRYSNILHFLEHLPAEANLPNRLIMYIELLSVGADLEHINLLLKTFLHSSDSFLTWIINNVKTNGTKHPCIDHYYDGTNEYIRKIIHHKHETNDENELIILYKKYFSCDIFNYEPYNLIRQRAPHLPFHHAADISKIFMKTNGSEKQEKTTLNKLKKIHDETDISFLNKIKPIDFQLINNIIDSLAIHTTTETQTNIIDLFIQLTNIFNISKKDALNFFEIFKKLNNKEVYCFKKIFLNKITNYFNYCLNFDLIVPLIQKIAKLDSNTKQAIFDDMELAQSFWNDNKKSYDDRPTPTSDDVLQQIKMLIKNAKDYKKPNRKTKDAAYRLINNAIINETSLRILKTSILNKDIEENSKILIKIIRLFITYKNKDERYINLHIKLHSQLRQYFESNYNFNFSFNSIFPVKHYDFFSQSMEKLLENNLGFTLTGNHDLNNNKTPLNFIFDFLTWILENYPKDKEYYVEIGLKTLNALHIWHNFRNNFNWTVKYRLQITKKFIQDFAASQGDKNLLNTEKLDWKSTFAKALEPNAIMEELLLLDHSNNDNHPHISELMDQYLRANGFV